MKIGFVTCEPGVLNHYFPTLAEPDLVPVEPAFTPDDQLAVNHLRQHGFTVQPIQWGTPIPSLHHFDLMVVRSPWDYMDTPENNQQFMHWIHALEASGARVANPANVMHWLLDKHYLRDLSDVGVRVIPTEYHEQHAQIDLLAEFEKRGAFILKPCVSAAGIGLYFIESSEQANELQTEVDARLQQQSYMLQDFISEIVDQGEWSLVFLGGEYSHAVHKKPGANSILVHAERGGSLSFGGEPSLAVVTFAKQVYQQIASAFSNATGGSFNPDLLLYLRIDVIETQTGPVLVECEGVEPELFFRARMQSEALFTQGVIRILQAS